VTVAAIIAVALTAMISLLALFFAVRLPLPAALDASIDVESMRSAFAAGNPDAALKDLFDSERERVTTAAKGLAASSAALVAAVVPPVLKQGLGLGASSYVVVVLAGAGIALLLATRAALSARRLEDELVFAYALRSLMRPHVG
jgi:hypothetical protein